MISRISGKILEIGLTSLVVDSAGLGYSVIVAPTIAGDYATGDSIELFTALIVREDSWTLYGFRSQSARELFQELQTVTGIGPKVAHSLLSFFTPEALRELIGQGDNLALEKVPGIGKKVASRIVLELQERYRSGKNSNTNAGKWRDSLHQALISLGYSPKEAERTIDATLKSLGTTPDDHDLPELLKMALANVRSGR